GGSASDRDTIDRRFAKLRRLDASKRRHHFDSNSKDMKKVPVTESNEPTAAARSASSPSDRAPAPDQTEGDDPVAGLQADLDRFRDLAMRSQADFENYKKRCAREKEEAIKYANKSLLEKLVSIVDHFELGLEAARTEGEKSPIYSGMNLVLKQ